MLVVPLGNGEQKIIHTGDIVKISRSGVSALGMRSSLTAEVARINKSRHTMDSEVELVRTNGENWGSHNGDILRIYVGDFISWFEIKTIPKNLRISQKFMFRDKNLEGMPCKKLSVLEGGDYFVELEENVGGCSCDGLGKAGHCVIIPSNILSEIEKSKRVKKKAK